MEVEVGGGAVGQDRAARGEGEADGLPYHRRPKLEPVNAQFIEAERQRRMKEGLEIDTAAAPARAFEPDKLCREAPDRKRAVEEIGGRDDERGVLDERAHTFIVKHLDACNGHVERHEAADIGDHRALAAARHGFAERAGQPALAGSGLQQGESEREQQQDSEETAPGDLERRSHQAHHRLLPTLRTPDRC